MEHNLLSLLDAGSYDTLKSLAKNKNQPVSLFLRGLINNANKKEAGFHRLGGTTLNYDQFKILNGNRSIDPARVSNIVKSIRKVGYITNPIIVNEKMEVIDGQGRLEALRSLDMPVDYIVCAGAGIDECIAMNVYQKNWTAMDYVKSFAQQGNQHYQQLMDTLEEFSDLPANTVISAFSNLLSEFNSVALKAGRFQVRKSMSYVRGLLSYLRRFNDLNLGTRKVRFFSALKFCYEHPQVDRERLYNALHRIRLDAFSSVADAIRIIEDAYNSRLSAARKIPLSFDFGKRTMSKDEDVE